MKNCPKCNEELEDGDMFCSHCGEKVGEVRHCANCGAELDEGAKFCSKCGASINTDKEVEIDYSNLDNLSIDELLELEENTHDAEVQLQIGLSYEKGHGCTKNYQEAHKWYKKAVEQGCANAQYHKGRCYEYGIGCNKHLEKAFFLFQKSADQGNNLAQCELARFYENGIGCEKDIKKSIKLYKKSAEQGNKKAEEALEKVKNNGTTQNYQSSKTDTSDISSMSLIERYLKGFL